MEVATKLFIHKGKCEMFSLGNELIISVQLFELFWWLLMNVHQTNVNYDGSVLHFASKHIHETANTLAKNSEIIMFSALWQSGDVFLSRSLEKKSLSSERVRERRMRQEVEKEETSVSGTKRLRVK